VHWTAYGVPPRTTRLAQGDAGGAVQGTNSFGKAGYGAPCPPHGQTHRYVFTLYALRSTPSLEAAAKPDEVRAAIAGAALARGVLTGRYGR
jgi:Raf kinase inhibitor-like YbhB/YbcL family protein